MSTVAATPVAQPDARVLGAVVVVGALADLAVRSGVTCLAGTLVVVAVAGSLSAGRRVRNPQAHALAGLAVVFAAFLTIRTSPFLVALDILAAGSLLALAASYARGGSVLDAGVPGLVARVFDALEDAVCAGVFAARSLPGSWLRRDAGPATRGVLIALPIVLVCGALLASADAVFAEVLQVRVDAGVVASHLVPFAFGAWGMAALLRGASSDRRPKDAALPRLGSVEALVVVGALDALFGVFVAAQVLTVAGGSGRVLDTAGLTYAEWARSGFFQLLAVATITLCVLVAVRTLAKRTSGLVAVSEVAVALTLVLVAVAARRLLLYVDAYGLTMLRLVSLAFAVWVALVFAMLAGAAATSSVRRDWLPFAAGSAGVVIALALNVVNAEALVVRHNVDHAERSGRFDAAYLSGLSEDAIPALSALDPVTRDAICVSRYGVRRHHGWAAYNLSRDRAARAVATVCAHAPPTQRSTR